MKQYSRIVSYLFHPLLIPVYSLLFYYTTSFNRMMDQRTMVVSLFYVILFSLLIPLIGLNWLHVKGAISSVDIPKQEDRVIPYLLCAACITVCAVLLAYKHVPPFIYSTLSAGALSIIICALINFWWKISIHSAAIGCWWGCAINVWSEWPLSYFAQHNFTIITTVTLIFGLVISARIASEQHSQSQVYVGALIGILIGYPLTHTMCAF